MPLTGEEQKLCRSIASRGPALLEDLRLHVGIPTGGFNAAGLDETRERFMDRLARLGGKCELITGDPKPEWLDADRPPSVAPPTLVCRGPASKGGEKRILISGHLDTVHDPKSPFRTLTVSADGKTATGPGCVDMKGGLVIAIAALEVLAEAGVPVSWTVIFNSDEETGSYHSDRTLRAEAARHDYGLALEPALPDGGLVVERPGSGQFMIECTGRAAHVGRDFTSGISAVMALARTLLQIEAMSDPAAGVVASVGPLEGGHATNIVPDRARAWGNVRFRTEELGRALTGKLDALCTSLEAMPRVSVWRSFNRPAKPLTPGTQKLAEAARAAAEDLGQKLPFGRTGGVCDGNNLQAAGLPVIDTLGVRGGGLHTPQEWIELASLVERCQLLAVLISRLGAAS
ncbi:MAG: M20/M25/M40 family metallo-hydrolase [Phycisphaerales bacterium]|nr:M20/M25/M40 family metallo-hydrolase [Phycisphaerales bacterium]